MRRRRVHPSNQKSRSAPASPYKVIERGEDNTKFLRKFLDDQEARDDYIRMARRFREKLTPRGSRVVESHGSSRWDCPDIG
ncbi:hypothetical protein [Actinopolyspora lacussalsi]